MEYENINREDWLRGNDLDCNWKMMGKKTFLDTNYFE
jgi:hypothetical protein